MAREAQKKIINGHEWEVYPWDAMHGLRMQMRLAPVVQAALGSAKGDLMDMDVAEVVSGLLGAVDDQRTPQLIRDMMHGVRVDGQDMSMDRPFNDAFAANYGELYQGLFFVLQVNFGDLFTMAGSIGGPAESDNKPAKKSPANSPKT